MAVRRENPKGQQRLVPGPTITPVAKSKLKGKVRSSAPTSVTREFTKYCVYYISGNTPAIGCPQDAEIDCFTETNDRAGIIYFFPDGLPLPPNRDTVNGIYLYFRMNRFADVMTMLKEEGPLHLTLDTSNGAGYIGTNFEPIGEQEGV